MLTPYMPVKKIEFLLREKSKYFRNEYHVYSMFYFDKDENVIYICSTRPGYWIGMMGESHRELVKQCNELIDKHNAALFDPHYAVSHIDIKYIECIS